MYDTNHLLKIAVLMAVVWCSDGCLWCDQRMTSRFTNCLFLEVASNPGLDVLERNMLMDMKASLYSASRGVDNKSPALVKEGIMNGALAGELSAIIASHTAATGLDPETATAQMMRLVGDCYYSVTQQPEGRFVDTLWKLVEDMVRDEMQGSSFPNAMDAHSNYPTQTRPIESGVDIPFGEFGPDLPPASSGATSFENGISRYNPPMLPPIRTASGNSGNGMFTPSDAGGLGNRQYNGIPPTLESGNSEYISPVLLSLKAATGNSGARVFPSTNTGLAEDRQSSFQENVPLYPPINNDPSIETVQGNSQTEISPYLNQGLNGLQRNDQITYISSNVLFDPSRYNENVSETSGDAGSISSNMGLRNNTRNDAISQTNQNVPLYPPSSSSKLSFPSNSNAQPSLGMINNRENTPISDKSQFKSSEQLGLSSDYPEQDRINPFSIQLQPVKETLPISNNNFQNNQYSGIRQFNDYSLIDYLPKQVWQDQLSPAVFQRLNDLPLSKNIEFGDRQFNEEATKINSRYNSGPTNNGFIYPLQNNNLNYRLSPSEIQMQNIQSESQYPPPFTNLNIDNKPLGDQLLPVTGFIGNDKKDFSQTKDNNDQSYKGEFSKIDYPSDIQQKQTEVINSPPLPYLSTTNNIPELSKRNSQLNSNMGKEPWQENLFKPITETYFTSQKDNSNVQLEQNGYIKISRANNNPQKLNVDKNRAQYTDISFLNQYDMPKVNPFVPQDQKQNQSPEFALSNIPKSESSFNLQHIVPEQPKNKQVLASEGQNTHPIAWNSNIPASNTNGFSFVPGSLQSNSYDFRIQNYENCPKTFSETLFMSLLKTKELQSLLGVNSIPSLVKYTVAESLRRTFIDIGYSEYSDEVFDYCEIQIGSLSEKSSTPTYAERITKSATDVLFEDEAISKNCADGAKPMALHILRWLEVLAKENKDFNQNSSSVSRSSSQKSSSADYVPQSSDSTSKADGEESDPPTQETLNTNVYEDCDDESMNISEQNDEENGNEDCEDQQVSSPTSEDYSGFSDGEQESSNAYDDADIEDCEDEQLESSSQTTRNNEQSEYCDDETEESEVHDDENEEFENCDDEIEESETSSASHQEIGSGDTRESVLTNSESRKQIELLMASARHSVSPNGYDLQGYVSVMASVADQMGIHHPDWNSNKVQVKTFTQSLVALTQVLQELVYPKSRN